MAATVFRMGRSVRADKAFEAWTSGDLSRMLAARTVKTNPIDRHHLLQGIVKETYRLRKDPEMQRLCIETGLLHLNELPTIVAGLRVDMDGDLPRIPLYAWLSTALSEAGRTDEAVNVCEVAALHGLEDGTKAGYRGRAERIAKRKGT